MIASVYVLFSGTAFFLCLQQETVFTGEFCQTAINVNKVRVCYREGTVLTKGTVLTIQLFSSGNFDHRHWRKLRASCCL